jgi:hypothetical protein
MLKKIGLLGGGIWVLRTFVCRISWVFGIAFQMVPATAAQRGLGSRLTDRWREGPFALQVALREPKYDAAELSGTEVKSSHIDHSLVRNRRSRLSSAGGCRCASMPEAGPTNPGTHFEWPPL